VKNANPFITATQVTFVHDTEDLCAACGGDGRVVVDDPEFAIRAPCPMCGGSGTGEDQRRREAERCRIFEGALGS